MYKYAVMRNVISDTSCVEGVTLSEVRNPYNNCLRDGMLQGKMYIPISHFVVAVQISHLYPGEPLLLDLSVVFIIKKKHYCPARIYVTRSFANSIHAIKFIYVIHNLIT